MKNRMPSAGDRSKGARVATMIASFAAIGKINDTQPPKRRTAAQTKAMREYYIANVYEPARSVFEPFLKKIAEVKKEREQKIFCGRSMQNARDRAVPISPHFAKVHRQSADNKRTSGESEHDFLPSVVDLKFLRLLRQAGIGTSNPKPH